VFTENRIIEGIKWFDEYEHTTSNDTIGITCSLLRSGSWTLTYKITAPSENKAVPQL
jgi:hypothetical protein